MKRIHVALAAVLALSVAGCQAFIPSHGPAVTKPNTANLAPVTFSFTGLMPRENQPAFGIQAVPTYAFTKARIEITGPGIAAPIKIDDVDITDGKGTFDHMVPMGPNRVFRAFAVDENGEDVREVVVGAVETIKPGENFVNLTWQGLPIAQAYLKLAELNSPHASTFPMSTVHTFVTTRLSTLAHPSLLNGYTIGSYIATNGSVPSVGIPNLTRATGKVQLQVLGLKAGESYDAWLEDPASELKSRVNTDALQEFPSVLAVTLDDVEDPEPLAWTLHVVLYEGGIPVAKIVQPNLPITIGGTKEVLVELAGLTYANIDFTNGDGNLPIDPKDLEPLEEHLYQVTIS